jgi:hypothetical protein
MLTCEGCMGARFGVGTGTVQRIKAEMGTYAKPR